MSRKLPTEIKRMQGTLQKCRTEPEPHSYPLISFDSAKRSEVYKNIKDRDVRKIFDRCCRLLEVNDMLCAEYLQNLAVYAFYVREFEEAVEQSKGHEFFEIHDINGNITGFGENPWLKRKDTAAKYILAIGSQFGFDAIAHQKIRPDERKNGIPKTILDAMHASAAQIVDYYEVKPTKEGENDEK